jgi:hypothetical protein
MTQSERAGRLNDYIAGIRKRVKTMDDAGEMSARTPEEWMAVAERVADIIARPGAGHVEIREAALTAAAAVFLATDHA